MKRIASWILAICMTLVLFPGTAKAEDESKGLSLEQLMDKFPEEMFWNGGDPDGYTDTPCTCIHKATHKEGTSDDCQCNYYDGSFQCAGFARKILFDAYGEECTNWPKMTSASYLDHVKPGDMIRYEYDGHSVVVIKVDGDMITVGECNEGKPCEISWDRTENKTHFQYGFTHIYVAPYELRTTSVHTHNFSITEYEATHPHKEYRKCSCGEVQYTGNTHSISTCDQCYPADCTIMGRLYAIFEDGREQIIPAGTFRMYNKENGKTYECTINNGYLSAGFKVPKGTYDVIAFCETKVSEDNCLAIVGYDIVINGATNLGEKKLKFSFVKPQIKVFDGSTDKALSGFDWELWKDGVCVEGIENDNWDHIIPQELIAGSTYTLKVHKDGYLDISNEISSLISSYYAVRDTAVYLQPTRGEFENGVRWELKDGTLTFSGEGPIPDFDSIPPWGYLGQDGLINHVEIKPGITHIGDRLLYSRWTGDNITVSIPSTVTSIGEVAFGFTNLEKTSLPYLEIPASVQNIEPHAFDGSKNLTIRFLGEAPNLSPDIFARCTDITVEYPLSSTWEKYIGQNLGAENTVQWESYGTAPEPVPNTAAESIFDVDHGKLEISPNPAQRGDRVTLTVTPDEGYYLYELTIVDSGGEEVSVTKNPDSTFTFVMPGSHVTIEATFVAVEEAIVPDIPADWVNPYTDVTANAWYYDAVAYVGANGLMNGITPTTFAPNDFTTRSMIWTILARMSGQDVDGATPWYAAAQEWAVNSGISNGMSPSLYISREELATMLYRTAGSPDVSGSLLTYPDGTSVSAWAEGAMLWASQEGIITGSDNLLLPHQAASRAQVAAMLQRYVETLAA